MQRPALLLLVASQILACAADPSSADKECFRIRMPAEYHTDGKLKGSSELPGNRERFKASHSTDQTLEVNCRNALYGVDGGDSSDDDTAGEPEPL